MAKTAVRARSAYRAWRDIPTRWMDNDVYGHVNNVVYYSYFDTAVNGWLVDQGLLDIHYGQQIGLVVETGCSYSAPISYPQTVQAGIAVRKIGNTSVHYEVGLFVEGNEASAAQGFFIHVYVDRHTRRPKALDAKWRAALERLRVA